jgi:outer membrane protein assembly factor BamB
MKRIPIKPTSFILITFIIVFGICTTYGITDDFDWPRWRGPNGNGISMETDWNPKALAGGPNILWKINVGVGHSNFVIKDNHLYTMRKEGIESVLICLNADIGEEIWRRPLEESFRSIYTTPTIEGKYLYAVSSEGVLYCLKSKNGKVRWERDLISEYDVLVPHYGISGSPVIEDDLVILNLNLSGIALNKNTGEMVWVSEKYHPSLICPTFKDMGGYATPVIYDHNGTRYALMYHCSGLFSVDVHTGEQQWFFKFMTLGANISDPILFSNKVFLSTGWAYAACTLVEIAGNQPKELWQNKNMRNEFSSCVYIDGYLYGSDGDHGTRARLRCIDVASGDVVWEKEMKMASLMAADGKLIILEEDGTLHIAEATPSAYQEISSCDVLEGEEKGRLFYTPPVLCNGKIYCRNWAGDLVCIDVSK